jgi:hypothetical protein
LVIYQVAQVDAAAAYAKPEKAWEINDKGTV